MTGTRLGPGREFDLIREILSSVGAGSLEGVSVPPGDDAAVVDAAGPLAVSCDLSVEDVHFRRSWLEPREVGYRSVAVSLSDLAAMAAEPIGVLVSVGLPDGTRGEGPELVRDLARGFRDALESVGSAAYLGGDVTRSPGPLILDVTVLGRAPGPVLRRGARPGDRVWVTGRLGGASGAVRSWEAGEEPSPALRAAFARPEPRIREAIWLAERADIHALVDLSDGLVGDAGHLAAAAGVRVVLDETAVPAHPALEALGWNHDEVARAALAGGEDYELCLAAAPGAVDGVADSFRERFDLELTAVGEVTEGEGLLLRPMPDAAPVPPRWRAFDHFGEGEDAR